MLVLSVCLTMRESEGRVLAFVRYMECALSLDKVDEAVRYERLQWATASFANEGHVLDENGEGGNAVEASE